MFDRDRREFPRGKLWSSAGECAKKGQYPDEIVNTSKIFEFAIVWLAHDCRHEKHDSGRHEIQERVVPRDGAHKNMHARDTSWIIRLGPSGESIVRGPTEVNHLLDERTLPDDLKQVVSEWGWIQASDHISRTAPLSSMEKGYVLS